ncbi:MAG: hypothetical protein ABEH35_08060 [Haloarculaceae archaeon]
MRLRDRIGVDEATQHRITRVMEVLLIGLLFVGLERRNTGIIVNTAVAIGMTRLPGLLERDYGIPLDPALTLWITSAAFLHAWGTVGIPGMEGSFYRSLPWWDHMTHALSSSLVAAVGYTTVRALDEHSDTVEFPPRFVFVFILLFVLAFGVLWEVIEFVIGEAAAMAGGAPVLTQYGLGDTMLDLVFDTVGAVIVAVWGTAHLTHAVSIVTERMARTE